MTLQSTTSNVQPNQGQDHQAEALRRAVSRANACGYLAGPDATEFQAIKEQAMKAKIKLRKVEEPVVEVTPAVMPQADPMKDEPTAVREIGEKWALGKKVHNEVLALGVPWKQLRARLMGMGYKRTAKASLATDAMSNEPAPF